MTTEPVGDAEVPLDGVRVVELGGSVAAAFATRLLAGFGADVVRVDGVGDGPPLTADEEVYLVAGKRRVAVPPRKSERPQSALDSRASSADIRAA